jgi:hypothetical protein
MISHIPCTHTLIVSSSPSHPYIFILHFSPSYATFSFFLFFCLGQAIVVGMGKKNPNAQKGRERRGKSKKLA